MGKTGYIDADFLKTYVQLAAGDKLPNGKKAKGGEVVQKRTLPFGERVKILEKNVEVVNEKGKTFVCTRIEAMEEPYSPRERLVKGEVRLREKGVLRFSMVDVQQGDGLVFETPEGKVVLIDGGENKMFARHLAARFKYKHTTVDNPLPVEAMIISHGDQDHMLGLNFLVDSETLTGKNFRKRIFIQPKRIFQNGLVKVKEFNPSTGRSKTTLGTTVKYKGKNYITSLYDDIREAENPNNVFQSFFESVNHWEKRAPIEVKRLARGMDADEVFGFLAEEGIKVEIQGPFSEQVESDTGELVDGLRKHGDVGKAINGNCIALRLSYGNVRFNLTGDLNQRYMAIADEHLEPGEMEAEVVKAPHHGSEDFDFAALASMRPVIALVSSGDEGISDHIHPRATLMAALGKVMRELPDPSSQSPVNKGVVMSTELAAYLEFNGESYLAQELSKWFKKRSKESFNGEQLSEIFNCEATWDNDLKADFPNFPKSYYGFDRKVFGIINIRTDGERLLVYSFGADDNLSLLEHYKFQVTMEDGKRVVMAEEVVEEG